MKRFKNIFFAVTFSIIAILSFSSCESDSYYWEEGTMDMESTINVPLSGKIIASLPIGYDWVYLNNNNRSYIEDIRYVGGSIEIIPHDNRYIDGFDLTLSNSDAILVVDLGGGSGGIIKGRQTDDFLNAVVEVVRRYGSATIYVDGRASGTTRFDLNFIIDIDAYVRN